MTLFDFELKAAELDFIPVASQAAAMPRSARMQSLRSGFAAAGRRIGTAVCGSAAAVARVLRGWRERDRQRRELSQMAAHDFGDIAVPPSLLREEVRRWPWQRPVAQWEELRTPRRSGPAAQP
jgi:uncharacterized protein YjiS (DUF1127 family)